MPRIVLYVRGRFIMSEMITGETRFCIELETSGGSVVVDPNFKDGEITQEMTNGGLCLVGLSFVPFLDRPIQIYSIDGYIRPVEAE